MGDEVTTVYMKLGESQTNSMAWHGMGEGVHTVVQESVRYMLHIIMNHSTQQTGS